MENKLYLKWWFWIIIAFVIMFVISSMINKVDSENPTCSVEKEKIEKINSGFLGLCEVTNSQIRLNNIAGELVNLYEPNTAKTDWKEYDCQDVVRSFNS